MTDDQHIFASFELHNNRLEPNDEIVVALAHWVAIAVLVPRLPIAPLVLFGVPLANLLVGESLAHSSINLV